MGKKMLQTYRKQPKIIISISEINVFFELAYVPFLFSWFSERSCLKKTVDVDCFNRWLYTFKNYVTVTRRLEGVVNL